MKNIIESISVIKSMMETGQCEKSLEKSCNNCKICPIMEQIYTVENNKGTYILKGVIYAEIHN